MTPQLYISVYKEQFASPGRASRAQLRPTSAHRRNNPQPRPDFLFPRSLQPRHRHTNTQPHPSPPVGLGRPPFPPVRHLSFNSPVTAGPSNCLNPADQNRPQHMPPVNPAAEPALPSAGAAAAQGRMDHRVNVHPHPPRHHGGVRLPTGPQTGNPPAASHRLPCIQSCRPHSNSALDHGGCYSCFHVVKPHQAGHYIIHPEFVSECLS